jgi:hypothetical protein
VVEAAEMMLPGFHEWAHMRGFEDGVLLAACRATTCAIARQALASLPERGTHE